MNTIEVINEFIKNEKYSQRKDILGIIFYGSSKYETATTNSDIDLLVITYQDINYKGVRTIDNKRIEFFEKSFSAILENLEELAFSQDASLISIFQNGELVYGDEISYNYLKEQLNIPKRIPKLKNKSKIKSYLNILNEVTDDSYKNYLYYNIVDLIRKKYHEENGYNQISGQKASKLYQDKEYAQKFYNLKLPDQEFIKLYLLAINSEYKKDILDNLLSRVSYTEELPTTYHHTSKKYLKSYSTVVESSLTRTATEFSNSSENMINSYYLTAEKIRILYCLANNINYDINYFGEEYDSEFTRLFDKAIKEISLANIIDLFNFASKNIAIDYKNYKILDLK